MARNGRLVFAVDALDGYIVDGVSVNGEDAARYERGKKNEYLVTGIADDETVVTVTTRLDAAALEGIRFALRLQDAEGNPIDGDTERWVGKGRFALNDPAQPPLPLEGYAYLRAELDGETVDAVDYETVDGIGAWYCTIAGQRRLIGKDATLTLIYAAQAQEDEAAKAEPKAEVVETATEAPTPDIEAAAATTTAENAEGDAEATEAETPEAEAPEAEPEAAAPEAEAAAPEDAPNADYVEVLLDEIESPDATAQTSEGAPAETANADAKPEQNPDASQEDAEPVNELENVAEKAEETDEAQAAASFAPVRMARISLTVVDEKGKPLADYRGKRVGTGSYRFDDAGNPPLDIPGYVYQQAKLDDTLIDTLECVDGEWVATAGNLKLIITEDATLTLRYKSVPAPKAVQAEAPEDVRLTLKVLDINGTTLADYTGRRVGKGRFKLDDADSAPMQIEGRTYVRAMLDGRIIETLEFNKEDGVWYATSAGNTFAVTHSATLVLFYR